MAAQALVCVCAVQPGPFPDFFVSLIRIPLRLCVVKWRGGYSPLSRVRSWDPQEMEGSALFPTPCLPLPFSQSDLFLLPFCPRHQWKT